MLFPIIYYSYSPYFYFYSLPYSLLSYSPYSSYASWSQMSQLGFSLINKHSPSLSVHCNHIYMIDVHFYLILTSGHGFSWVSSGFPSHMSYRRVIQRTWTRFLVLKCAIMSLSLLRSLVFLLCLILHSPFLLVGSNIFLNNLILNMIGFLSSFLYIIHVCTPYKSTCKIIARYSLILIWCSNVSQVRSLFHV